MKKQSAQILRMSCRAVIFVAFICLLFMIKVYFVRRISERYVLRITPINTRWKHINDVEKRVTQFARPTQVHSNKGVTGDKTQNLEYTTNKTDNNDILTFTNEHDRDSADLKKDDMKKILLYTPFWGYPAWGLGLGRAVFLHQQCPETRCEVTDDIGQLSQSDAVLFHIHELGEEPPSKVKRDQVWIFFMLECPGWSRNTNYRHKQWKDRFNWTLTYRWDSTLPMYNGAIVKITNSKGSSIESNTYPDEFNANLIKNNNTELSNTRLSKKKKLVAWMVSNCGTQSRRDEYVKELQKYIPVDVYGRCGTLQCSRDEDESCMEMINRDYKFYLSFENSFCKDYVTEKFFKVLEHDIVPIVRGGANYRNLVPKDTKWYIDAKDFKSARELAEYLLFLDKHDDEYLKHFAGKSQYEFKTFYGLKNPVWCDLCSKLHNTTSHGEVMDVSRWWGPQDCTAPSDI